MNVRVLGKGLELLSVNGGTFEINQLLFADDTTPVADSEEKLCRLVSQFDSVCERRKLRVNVGKSKVIRCSRYGNGDLMHVTLNGEPLEKVILYTNDICSCGMGVRIQPTPAFGRVVRGDYLRDMSYPLPPAHCMQGILECNGAYELG